MTQSIALLVHSLVAQAPGQYRFTVFRPDTRTRYTIHLFARNADDAIAELRRRNRDWGYLLVLPMDLAARAERIGVLATEGGEDDDT